MAKKNAKTSKIKIKRKIWYKIQSPKIFGSKDIGETYLSDIEGALGRNLKVNLRDLTGNVKDQNVYISFIIDKVNGSTLMTSTIGYELATAYIKRAVRKGTDRIDDFLKLKSKGGKKIILKSLVITLGKAQNSTKAQLKKDMAVLIEEEFNKSTFEQFLTGLINRSIVSAIKKKLNKVYPIKEVAVRVVKLDEKGLEAGAEEIVVEDITEENVESAEAKEEEDVAEEKETEDLTEEEADEADEEEDTKETE